MASGVNPSKIETDQLLDDFLFSNSSDVMRFSFGFCLGNQLISLFLLGNVVLNEVFFRVIFKSQPRIQNLINFLSDLSEKYLKFSVFLAEVHVLDFFSEEQRKEDVRSCSGTIKDINSKFCKSNRERGVSYFLFGSFFREENSDQNVSNQQFGVMDNFKVN